MSNYSLVGIGLDNILLRKEIQTVGTETIIILRFECFECFRCQFHILTPANSISRTAERHTAF